MKIIELCLEIVDPIIMPLQLILVPWKGTLGFRLCPHHYLCHHGCLMLACTSVFAVYSTRVREETKNIEVVPFIENFLEHVTLSGQCSVTLSDGRRWETNHKDSETQSASFAAT